MDIGKIPKQELSEFLVGKKLYLSLEAVVFLDKLCGEWGKLRASPVTAASFPD